MASFQGSSPDRRSEQGSCLSDLACSPAWRGLSSPATPQPLVAHTARSKYGPSSAAAQHAERPPASPSGWSAMFEGEPAQQAKAQETLGWDFFGSGPQADQEAPSDSALACASALLGLRSRAVTPLSLQHRLSTPASAMLALPPIASGEVSPRCISVMPAPTPAGAVGTSAALSAPPSSAQNPLFDASPEALGWGYLGSGPQADQGTPSDSALACASALLGLRTRVVTPLSLQHRLSTPASAMLALPPIASGEALLRSSSMPALTASSASGTSAALPAQPSSAQSARHPLFDASPEALGGDAQGSGLLGLRVPRVTPLSMHYVERRLNAPASAWLALPQPLASGEALLRSSSMPALTPSRASGTNAALSAQPSSAQGAQHPLFDASPEALGEDAQGSGPQVHQQTSSESALACAGALLGLRVAHVTPLSVHYVQHRLNAPASAWLALPQSLASGEASLRSSSMPTLTPSSTSGTTASGTNAALPAQPNSGQDAQHPLFDASPSVSRAAVGDEGLSACPEATGPEEALSAGAAMAVVPACHGAHEPDRAADALSAELSAAHARIAAPEAAAAGAAGDAAAVQCEATPRAHEAAAALLDMRRETCAAAAQQAPEAAREHQLAGSIVLHGGALHTHDMLSLL